MSFTTVRKKKDEAPTMKNNFTDLLILPAIVLIGLAGFACGILFTVSLNEFAPAATVTMTPTSTVAPTLTDTPTLTVTITPSRTPSATATNSPSPTSTRTLTPTSTATPQMTAISTLIPPTLDPTPTAEIRRFFTPAVALLNYRAGPGAEYSVRGQLRPGDVLMLMRSEGDWWAMCLVTLIAPYDCFGTYWVASWLLVETSL